MRTLLILCFLVLAASPSMAYGDEPIEALRKGVQEGLQVLQGPKFTDQELKEAQQQKLRLILERLFDFHEFSRRVLASNWKNFTPSQRKTFIEVFTEFLGKFYMGKLQEKYKDERLIFESQEFKTPTRALVHIRVVWKGQKIPIDLLMIKRKGQWRVYDIQFLGVSAVRNYRAQFNSLLRKETPDQVIERMRQRIRKIDSEKKPVEYPQAPKG
ncbi:MAG: ABC transporter substrate-binding protein [Desulfobacterales bacterium]|nr:ABC transporter substrate-binding protein [Desulfobacterales bacterium]